METSQAAPQHDQTAALVGYMVIRHVGFILDEFSEQGLELWRDQHGSWHWRWRATTLQSTRGFWALGEAVVDAVVMRFPAVFATAGDVAGG